MADRKLRFIVVGSGWRSLFYWRTAQAYPEIFCMEAMVCRTEEKAEKMRREHGVPAMASERDCDALRPDFVIVAVNKEAIPQVAEEWAGRGFPVLLETPAAMDVAALKRLWKQKEEGARIQVAEQYSLYPSHAAAIAAVRHGYLGDPYAVDISTAHDYHAASLIRRYLNIGICPVAVRGEEYYFPVEETDSRYGPVTDGTVKERRRVRASFEFKTGGGQKKYAFYDFDSVQYHSLIRSRHLSVKGQTGELCDGVLRCMGEEHMPQTLELVYEYKSPAPGSGSDGGIQKVRICGKGREGQQPGGGILYENPFSRLRQSVLLPEDETAVGTILLGMRRFLEEGKEVYPLAEALEDAYMRILMEQAIDCGMKVESETMPWHHGQGAV